MNPIKSHPAFALEKLAAKLDKDEIEHFKKDERENICNQCKNLGHFIQNCPTTNVIKIGSDGNESHNDIPPSKKKKTMKKAFKKCGNCNVQKTSWSCHGCQVINCQDCGTYECVDCEFMFCWECRASCECGSSEILCNECFEKREIPCQECKDQDDEENDE